MSHETVSRYVHELDAELEPWRTRKLEGTELPYLMVDARYEKARVDGQVVDVAVLVAVGVDWDGYRQVLGVEVVYGETEQTWPKFLAGLREHGLSGVQLVVSDDHAGLGRAWREHFPALSWQRCQRHFLQNALERTPARLVEELHERLRAVWDHSETHEEAAPPQGLGLWPPGWPRRKVWTSWPSGWRWRVRINLSLLWSQEDSTYS